MKKQVGQNTRRSWRWWLILIVLVAAASGCSSGGGSGFHIASVTYYDLTGQPAAPRAS